MSDISKRSIGVIQGKNTPSVAEDYELASNEEKIQILSQSPHTLIQSKEKTITIGKKQYVVDANDLIAMIRRTTSNIGQYNENNNEPYAAYITHALRTARIDMASALASNFGIHFTIEDGKSIFYLG